MTRQKNPSSLKKTFELQALQFSECLNDVANTQHQQLNNTLTNNKDSKFGNQYHFKSIHSTDDYRYKIPISEYEDYHHYIECIKMGEMNVLTKDPVSHFELTSGSTGHYKLIPYTSSLYQDFQNGVSPWLYTIYQSYPNLETSPYYWSITPSLRALTDIASKVPIGIGNDFGYFSSEQQKLLQNLSAVPFDIKNYHDINEFKANTLLHLLNASPLAFISVWSPSYLLSLFDYFNENVDLFLTKINLKLQKIWAIHSHSPKQFFSAIWPKLSLISCWKDAHAAEDFKILQSFFPEIPMQGKGLVATEGIMSFPYLKLPTPILAVRSHFFEFKPLAATNNTYLSHELEIGQSYEIILTTNGGLYRYNTHDVVEIVDYYKQAPLFNFKGRNLVMDFVGEKINELQLLSLINHLKNKFELHSSFLMCAPEKKLNQKLCYVIFIQSAHPPHQIQQFVSELEAALIKNYHYCYARRLGQLDSVQAYKISAQQKPNEIYLKRHYDTGKQLGQIKSAMIDKLTGWSSHFEGTWV